MARAQILGPSKEENSVEIAESKAQPSASLTNTDDSIPSLYKIRFDDHVVAITDPEPEVKVDKKTKKHKKGKSSPPEEIKTAETFELGQNSEELVLIGPGNKRTIYNMKTRPEVHENELEAEKAKKAKKEVKAKQDVAPPELDRKELVDKDEPCIRIGDRLLSRDETTNLLARLGELKNEHNRQQRRLKNFNNIDSTRTSKLGTATEPTSPAPFQQKSTLGKEAGQRGGPSAPSSKEAGQRSQPASRESTTRPYRPRPNFNRIESCRTSRANSPQDSKNTGKPKKRIRMGDHFMTVEEAEDLLLRLLKANANKPAKRPSSSRPNGAEDISGKSRAQPDQKRDEQQFYNVKVDNRVVAVPVVEPPKNDDADCNFSHLNSVIRTEDEVNALILSFIVGAVLFIGLCMIVAKRT